MVGSFINKSVVAPLLIIALWSGHSNDFSYPKGKILFAGVFDYDYPKILLMNVNGSNKEIALEDTLIRESISSAAWTKAVQYESPTWASSGKDIVFIRISLLSRFSYPEVQEIKMLSIRDKKTKVLFRNEITSDSGIVEDQKKYYNYFSAGVSLELEAYPLDYSYPRMSPGGESLVFEAMPFDTLIFPSTDTTHVWPEIYVLDIETQKLSRLTHNNKVDYYPYWSPDGKKIVFLRNLWEHSRTQDLYIMDADGKNERKISKGKADRCSPIWMKDGKIVYSIGRWIAENKKYMLGMVWDTYTIDPKTGKERKLFDNVYGISETSDPDIYLCMKDPRMEEERFVGLLKLSRDSLDELMHRDTSVFNLVHRFPGELCYIDKDGNVLKRFSHESDTTMPPTVYCPQFQPIVE